jgi:hypothetical protein
MKTTIEYNDFVNCNALKGNFSYAGRVALFEYLEQNEKDLGYEFDFDPVGLRCDYAEYANLAEFWKDYDRYEYQSMRDIENETSVIYIGNSEAFIILQF